MKRIFVSVLIIFAVMILVNSALSVVMPEVKVAIIDIKTIINASSDVKNLKTERQKQIDSLNKFIEEKKNSLEKETDIKKRKNLEGKFNEEFEVKKEFAQKSYEKQVNVIHDKIYKLIGKEAQTKGYDIVLSKSAVLYGGENITNNVTCKMK